MSSEQRASRSVRRSADAMLARDWNAHAACFAEVFRYDDRRAGLQSSGGKTENIEQVRVLADLGVDTIDFDVIETRGERFVLSRGMFYANDFMAPLLLVTAIDEDERQLVGILFDEDDLDAARAELDALATNSG